MIDLNIGLPDGSLTHLPEISEQGYNYCNYYKLEHSGDWLYGDFDILRERYHSSTDVHEYSFGRIINGEFVGIIFWNMICEAVTIK